MKNAMHIKVSCGHFNTLGLTRRKKFNHHILLFSRIHNKITILLKIAQIYNCRFTTHPESKQPCRPFHSVSARSSVTLYEMTNCGNSISPMDM